MRLLLCLLLVCNLGFSQSSVFGKWKTVDENTGKVTSIIEITERKGKVYGKVMKVFTRTDPDPICEKCDPTDERYKKKVVGMEIMKDMEKNEDEYSEGNILDPQDGKVYKCKIWLEGSDLKVRGYWGPFYRTQTWIRFPN